VESLVANVSEVGYTVIHARRRWNRTRHGAQTKERRFAWLGKTTWILELAKALVAHGIQCIVKSISCFASPLARNSDHGRHSLKITADGNS
jgi:hypothetical protein